MALCKKFGEIYEYGKLLREKGGALTRQIYIKAAPKNRYTKIVKQNKSFYKFKQIWSKSIKI